jgi:hypothetical protein
MPEKYRYSKQQSEEILTMYLRRLEQEMTGLQSVIDDCRNFLKNKSGWDD